MSVEEYNQMLVNEGIAIGKTQGKAERDAEHVKTMAEQGYSLPEIAIALGMSEDAVRAILAKAA